MRKVSFLLIAGIPSNRSHHPATPKHPFLLTSSWEGAAILIPKHLDLTGSMTLLGLLQHSISRHDDEYFSMVRRSAACACRVSLSTSTSTTTL
jgi:hypothetical protein